MHVSEIIFYSHIFSSCESQVPIFFLHIICYMLNFKNFKQFL